MTTYELKPCPFCGVYWTEKEIEQQPEVPVSDIELLPLHYDELPEIPEDIVVRMQAYARAIAAKDAEIDTLRTRLEDTVRDSTSKIEALRAENEAMKRCAIKYLGWLGVTHIPLVEALRMDMSDPTMCGDAALTQEMSMTTETSNARGEWPARYACNGPEGTFWTDDATLANKLIAATFDRDEWTVTDTQNPTAAPQQYDEQTQPKLRRYDPYGSLSEYGIFPECDAQPLEHQGDK